MGKLQKALTAIAGLPHTHVEAVSDVISSPAQGHWAADVADNAAAGIAGVSNDPAAAPQSCGADFLNCCCRIETELSPEALLDALQQIEISLGRPEHSPVFDSNGIRVYSDRTIDIDILLYGDLTINTDRLQIPHPRMQERDFVMTPLRQVLEG